MNRELKVGIIALLSVSVLVIGINYLKGINVLNKHKVFYAKYDNIGGLQVGSSVSLNGYKVGSVSEISLLRKNNLLVTLNIEKDFDIPKNTICKIVNKDLMGAKSIDLILGDANKLAIEGDTLFSNIEGSLQDEVNAQILPLKLKTEELIGSIDSVMTIITAVLNKDTRKNLRNSLASLNETFEIMTQTMTKIDSIVIKNDDRLTRIIINLESITKNLEEGNEDIKTVLVNFASVSKSLNSVDIEESINNINDITSKINNGDGSLALLLENDEIYLNLEQSSKELSELIEDIKNNPSRYVNFSLIGGGKKYNPKDK
tara:strand:+ start:7285 stop:8232 length:948 start_codon:yes stop_codon:yes gene_type:complete